MMVKKPVHVRKHPRRVVNRPAQPRSRELSIDPPQMYIYRVETSLSPFQGVQREHPPRILHIRASGRAGVDRYMQEYEPAWAYEIIDRQAIEETPLSPDYKDAAPNELFGEIKDRLLKIAGTGIDTWMEGDELFIKEILDRGIHLPADDIGLKMKMDEYCHHNVAEIYDEDEADVYRIMTGYALHPPTGLWYRHSWLIDRDGKLWETCSVEFSDYFGIVIDDEEIEDFMVQARVW